jgi:uncharacterized damage-inducible protein DinB
MSNTLQEFLAVATQKASVELVAALQRLPEDKRDWSPAETARTAFDQVAECAILNGYTANLIQTRVWPSNGYDEFLKAKTELLSQGWEALHALLQENTLKAIAAIRTTPDDVLQTEIELPFAKATLAEILAYPYWNMSYHQGQINYIASILGSLK